MTDNVIDYAAIRARLNAATEGPWRTSHAPNGRGQRVTNKDGLTLFVNERPGQQRASRDAVFIAHSRTDLEQLLDRVEELEATIGRVEGVITEFEALKPEVIPSASTHAWVHEFRAALAAVPADGEES